MTVTIDDETYRNARIAAAADDTSVSAVVREFLRLYAAESNVRGETAEARFERLWKRQQDLREGFKGFSAADRLSRDDLYDRSRKR